MDEKVIGRQIDTTDSQIRAGKSLRFFKKCLGF